MREMKCQDEKDEMFLLKSREMRMEGKIRAKPWRALESMSRSLELMPRPLENHSIILRKGMTHDNFKNES